MLLQGNEAFVADFLQPLLLLPDLFRIFTTYWTERSDFCELCCRLLDADRNSHRVSILSKNSIDRIVDTHVLANNFCKKNQQIEPLLRQVKLQYVFAYSTGSFCQPRLMLLACGENGKAQCWLGGRITAIETLAAHIEPMLTNKHHTLNSWRRRCSRRIWLKCNSGQRTTLVITKMMKQPTISRSMTIARLGAIMASIKLCITVTPT